MSKNKNKKQNKQTNKKDESEYLLFQYKFSRKFVLKEGEEEEETVNVLVLQ